MTEETNLNNVDFNIPEGDTIEKSEPQKMSIRKQSKSESVTQI